MAVKLRGNHPESFRPLKDKGRHGNERENWGFTKFVRLKRRRRK